jgi:hypothetical protein
MSHTTHRSLLTRPVRLLFALALALVPILGLASTPALAASGDCTTSGATVTCTFTYTGAAQTWTVPDGVNSASLQLVGAPGGQSGGISFPHAPEGMGARVTADIPLTPRTTVTVVVGGPGGTIGDESGGFNGGGGAPYVGNLSMQGGGGGGGGGYIGTEPGDYLGSGGGGGGGGASFADPRATSVTIAVDTTGGPKVVITYAVPTDPISPSSSPSPSPKANSAGWNKTDVTVDWRWADNAGGSGLNLAACTMASTSSGEGTFPLSANCADQAGNVGSASYTVKVDKTAPTIALANRTAPNASGWNNSAVTVDWTCGDALSGAVSTNVSATLAGDGTNQSTTGTCTDNAGNSSSNTQTGINIDTANPTLNPVVSSNPVQLGGNATVTPNASDSLSGIASQSCGALDTASVGTKTVTCTSTDNAGNTASASITYQVIYSWSGFFQPIDNLPTVNSVKAGQAIPVKFSLGGNYGLNILASGSPASQPIACGSGAPVDEIEQR